ncbi:putative periplasmic solute-binding protein [Desulfitobacterium dichloroeliminans LMG P-21439]|uniref:Putative periplasmic solute-binding protein n=1 Tax=Desulfitobacterium dichloroeliminans (strain LMG P-21439 / DCA1) TaxID=871963 RepID=L0F2N1_DESDL|nr:endolytic transglycosylase MltG [Desulfitobacterium dichloroeliminans]AGA68084.1 putative periplasmic solute-binding protein [Desulfitobacterium dichloroeliminans LMG P-21439]
MKISRSYVLGLGSGLILSALIAMVMPPLSINLSEDTPPAQQTTNPNPNVSESENPSAESSQDQNTSESEGEESAKPPTEDTPKVESKDATAPFMIPAGSTADRIADLLLAEGWIASKEEFLNLVKEGGLASKFRAGSYELSQEMNTEEILDQLIQ